MYLIRKLIDDLFDVMYETGADFTNSFRKLSDLKFTGRENLEKDLNEFLEIISKELRPLEETKNFYKPKFPIE